MEISNDIKRTILFFVGCITTRILFAQIAMKNPKQLKKLALIALIPVFGWLRIMFISPRNTGVETFGGKIWWNNLRPIHMLNYILFAFFAFQGKSFAYKFLVLDVVIGFLAEINHRFIRFNY